MLWPEGLRATVAVTVSGERKAPGIHVRWNAKGSYVMSLDSAASTIRISEFSGWTGKLPAFLEDLPGFVAPFLAAVVVSPRGGFVRLEDVPAAREAILAHMKSTGLGRKTPAEARARMFSDAALEGLARIAWGRLYEAWVVAPLAVGESRPSTVRGPVEHEGGYEIDVHVTHEHRGEAACPGAPTRTCQTLVMTTHPDAQQVLEAMHSRPDLKPLGIQSYEENNEFAVVAEVGTLIPFAVRERTTSRARRKAGTEVRTGERTQAFAYDGG
jgi:hypothetical protein